MIRGPRKKGFKWSLVKKRIFRELKPEGVNAWRMITKIKKMFNMIVFTNLHLFSKMLTKVVIILKEKQNLS